MSDWLSKIFICCGSHFILYHNPVSVPESPCPPGHIPAINLEPETRSAFHPSSLEARILAPLPLLALSAAGFHFTVDLPTRTDLFPGASCHCGRVYNIPTCLGIPLHQMISGLAPTLVVQASPVFDRGILLRHGTCFGSVRSNCNAKCAAGRDEEGLESV